MTNLVKKAPVTSLSAAEAIVAFVLTTLTTHHVIGNVDVSSTVQTVAPFVALALPALFGALKWALVSPYAKVKDVMERDGLMSDADFSRLEQIVEDRLGLTVPAADVPADDPVPVPPGAAAPEPVVPSV